MAGLALGLWIVTASVGLHLWTRTTEVGRPESGSMRSDLPPLLLFLHPLVGLGGLAVWIAYVVSGATWLAWLALGWLVVGIGLGEILFVRTLRSRRVKAAAAASQPDPRIAENHMPAPALALHGGLAFALVGLVLAEALTA